MTTNISRRGILAGSLAAGVAALAGCAGSPASPGGGASGGESLQVWGGVPGENGPDALCKAFADANPGVTVTYTRYVNDDQGNVKLDTSLQGGVPIDVFFSYGPDVFARRAGAGLALDLTEKIESDQTLAEFHRSASVLKNPVIDDKLYTLPCTESTNFVFVNKAIFDAAGIGVPTAWTTDEFTGIAAELTKGKVIGAFDSPMTSRGTLGSNWLYADDGRKSNFTNPAFSADIARRLQMQQAGTIMPRQRVLAEKLTTFQQKPFLAGELAMLGSSAYVMRYIKDLKEYPHEFVTAAAPEPKPAGDASFNTGGLGDFPAVSSKSANPDLAWKFVHFWFTNAATHLAAGGRVPSAKLSAADATTALAAMTDNNSELFDLESFKTVLFGQPRPRFSVDTIFTAQTELITIKNKLEEEVLLGARDLSTFAAEATKQGDAALATAS